MSAAVIKTGHRVYQAWCDQCQDGVNSPRRTCDDWADTHNAKHHPEEDS
jgi:hypothetical protein